MRFEVDEFYNFFYFQIKYFKKKIKRRRKKPKIFLVKKGSDLNCID